MREEGEDPRLDSWTCNDAQAHQGSTPGHSPDEVVIDKEYHEAKRSQGRHDDGEV